MTIPKEIKSIIKALADNGHEGYIVGGCVRDLLVGKKPYDWDITTNAKPDEVQKMFPDSFYENAFGTVGVKTGSEDETLAIVEVTTYRIESKYTDKRHPDAVKFTDKLEDDLARRDFTINAIAADVSGKTTDPFNGLGDLKSKIIRAVGDPKERFGEDALRMMRAVRFSATLGFEIEDKTFASIKLLSGSLRAVSKERVRDELVKIINSPRASRGIQALADTGLMEHIMPELLEGIGVGQNLHHIYNVWEHNLRALQYTADKNYSFEVRMASLLHDVGKPRSKRGEGLHSTFYAHEIIGAKMTAKIVDRLKFPREAAEKIIHLVRFHLFYYNVGEVTEAGVRRFLSRVGAENVDDLLKVREADRIGSGVPKAFPYKLRHLQFMIDKVKKDPISAKMLKVNGEDVMKIAGIEAGPRVGQILAILLEEVLDNPAKNTRENLEARIAELNKMSEKELITFSKRAKEKKEEFESGVVEDIKKKYYIS